MKGSLIQWTDNTYNPWLGCRKVAPECAFCYIVRQTPLRVRGIQHGATRHRCAETTRRAPHLWEKNADAEGTSPRVFCLSLGDWLDDEVPIEWFAELMQTVRECPHLRWQLLTKRPQNWRTRVEKAQDWHFDYGDRNVAGWLRDWRVHDRAPANVQIGVSAGADQGEALKIPAKVHFLSCEPMLEEMDPTHVAKFDQVIFGGESFPGGEPRPFDVIFLDRAIKFCQQHGVPVFVKQMGGSPTYYKDSFDDGMLVTGAGWHKNVKFPGGCTIKLGDGGHGGNWDEWPERFRIREFPQVSL